MNDAPTPAVPAAPATLPPGAHRAELSSTDAEKMAGWVKDDREKGKLTPEQAAKAFDDMGTPMDQRGPDTRSDEVRELDAHFPPAQPHEYKISYADRGGDEPPRTPELTAFDANARGWMHEAGLPLDIGNSLVTTIDKAAQVTQGMSAGQLEVYRQTELMKLQRVYGEQLKERLQAVDNMIDQLEQRRPGLLQLLESNGIGKNAMVWNLLISHAEIYHARRGG